MDAIWVGEKDLNKLFDMVSIIPGEALKFQYDIKEGNKANFIVIDAKTKSRFNN